MTEPVGPQASPRRHSTLNALSAARALAFAAVLPLFFSVGVQAQETSGRAPLFGTSPVGDANICSQAYLNALPNPIPPFPYVRTVQLVNCSSQVLLGAANAAHKAGEVGYPVFPREKTWVMQPYQPNCSHSSPGSCTNVLTIDIPAQWSAAGCPQGNKNCGASSPNIWARTGCRYDIAANRAQCETGGCGGLYDCSAAALSASGFTSITEWTFYQPTALPTGGTYYVDNFDISLVNGASLNVDIMPVGGSNFDPGSAANEYWLGATWPATTKVPAGSVYPLSKHGADLRTLQSKNNPLGCPAPFVLKRSDIDKTVDQNGVPLYQYVQLDNNGVPVGGDNTLACFSNCGLNEFPYTPPAPCMDPTDPSCYCTPDSSPAGVKCYAWKTFCAGDPFQYASYPPGHSGSYPSIFNCINPQNNQYDDSVCPVNGACWHDPGSNIDGTCQLRAFYKNDASLCPQNICTYKYGYVNPLLPVNLQLPIYSSQPPAGMCSNVTDPAGNNPACIGDDTVHQIFHGAYTWPNDPETYADDAPLYRVIYAPGGTTEPITPATNGIPVCSSLSSLYGYAMNAASCSVPIQDQNALLAVACLAGLQGCSSGNKVNWGCALDQLGSGNNGVICRWKPANYAPSKQCTLPATGTDISQSACGWTEGQGGTTPTVQSSSIKPNGGDWLFAEVTIPQVLNPVSLPSMISGCATWTQTPVAQQFIHTDQGLTAWYMGQVQTGSTCNVTVTLAQLNPAALKVYDVPKANGKLDGVSGATGSYTCCNLPFPAVSTGPITTTHAGDLLLGNLLMVNQLFTPQVFWTDWMSNANLTCPLNGKCPVDDGADYLPGHGIFSSNSEAGHQRLTKTGTYSIERHGHNTGDFNYGGSAIAVQIK